MVKFAALAIVLCAGVVSRSQEIDPEIDTWRWNPSERQVRSTDSADAAIREIFQKIASGESDTSDDDDLFKLIKEEIIRTAKSIRTPNGSIEAAAQRAQRLVSEMTSAYTTAIYESKSTEDARRNFGRFQSTVQRIVDFTKSGQFVT